MENTPERQLALARVFNDSTSKHDKEIDLFEDAYSALEIGAFSEAVINDLTENGTANIEAKLKASIENQIIDLKITSPLLKTAISIGIDVILATFNEKVDNLVTAANEAVKQAKFEQTIAKQMTIKFLNIGAPGNSIKNIQEKFKSLEVGAQADFTTTCGKTFKFIPSRIHIDASETAKYFIYAKLAIGSDKATLVVFETPQANTPEHLLIFWKAGKFEEINF